MKKIYLFFIFLFGSTSLVAVEIKPIWLSSVCFQLDFEISDKMASEKTTLVLYTVLDSEGVMYQAERNAVAFSPQSSAAKFPDDFTIKGSKIRASADCYLGKRYRWEIHIDGQRVDSGFWEFRRDNRVNKH